MEEWKDVANSEFYQVSNMGRVRVKEGELKRKDGKPYPISPHLVTPFLSRSGYYIITLRYDIPGKMLVHRLVLKTFSPREDSDELLVNHIDGDKTNNRLENLEWCSRKENVQHAMALGVFRPQDRFGEKHPLCKLTQEQVKEIKGRLTGKRGEQRKLANEYGVSDATISEIKTGRTRKKG